MKVPANPLYSPFGISFGQMQQLTDQLSADGWRHQPDTNWSPQGVPVLVFTHPERHVTITAGELDGMNLYIWLQQTDPAPDAEPWHVTATNLPNATVVAANAATEHVHGSLGDHLRPADWAPTHRSGSTWASPCGERDASFIHAGHGLWSQSIDGAPLGHERRWHIRRTDQVAAEATADAHAPAAVIAAFGLTAEVGEPDDDAAPVTAQTTREK
ncbi:hypothetical protein [Catenulispora rubra]|uniref:hypothetical protein n=1 Tax=Catenulispora rubra TaxID=280293 RepID=UPI0018928702|nr:hypothetical protein [Catenulispora rubra]